MRVRDMIAELQKMDPDADVPMSPPTSLDKAIIYRQLAETAERGKQRRVYQFLADEVLR